MREDDLFDLVNRHAQLNERSNRHDELARIIAQHLRTEYALVCVVDNELNDSVAAFVLREVAPGKAHWNLDDRRVQPLGLRACFRLANRGKFRIGVQHAGNRFVTHRVLFAEHHVHGNLRLAVGRVREHGLSVDVPRRVDLRLVRLHVRVGHDCAALGEHMDVLEPDILRVGASSNREQHLVAGDFLHGAVLFVLHCVCGYFRHLGGKMERYAALFESLLQNCDEFRVVLARDVI